MLRVGRGTSRTAKAFLSAMYLPERSEGISSDPTQMDTLRVKP
jgi:hypothetical protein